MMAGKKLGLFDFYEMKHQGKKVTWLTSYDFPTAQFAEAAGLDMLLVGDSLGMCVYGYSGTVPVTMDQCIVHCDAVRRGAPNTFVMGDMPFLSYQTSDSDAVYNAGRFLKEAEVDAVKLEGGVRVASQIRAITDAGVTVCGHIGLTPQSSGLLGGHKAQGRTAEAARLVVEDALAVQEAGARMLLVEAVPPEVAGYIARLLDHTGLFHRSRGLSAMGSYLIVSDVMGQFQAFTPKFVKKYLNLAELVTQAMRDYCKDVKGGNFPEEQHCYPMVDGEEKKFLAQIQEKYGE
jgi:3-methyl-2-oxobutanoate hydroxymethyltransferase